MIHTFLPMTFKSLIFLRSHWWIWSFKLHHKFSLDSNQEIDSVREEHLSALFWTNHLWVFWADALGHYLVERFNPLHVLTVAWREQINAIHDSFNHVNGFCIIYRRPPLPCQIKPWYFEHHALQDGVFMIESIFSLYITKWVVAKKINFFLCH